MPEVKHIPRIAYSVTNCICHDQRVLKMAGVVRNLGADITIIGREKGECCKRDSVPFKTKRFRMIFKKGFLFYKFFNIRLFFYLLWRRFDLLVANDLDTLLPNFIVSKIRRTALIYDSHEYFTGVPEIQNRRIVKWVWKTIEKVIFPRLKYVITVSDSIADQYYKEYGIRPVTVRNCSLKSDHIAPVSRDDLGICQDHLLFVLQGTGINTDRGGEELIEAVRNCGKASLLIIGSGDQLQLLKEKVVEYTLSERVRFLPKMPWEEMMRYTKSADAGMSLDKNTNINHRFSLPNKVFDYISAGIPVIAGDLPEITRLVSEQSCGVIIPEVTPEEVGQAIKLLSENRDLLKVLKQNAKGAAEIINWENESFRIKELYLSALAPLRQ